MRLRAFSLVAVASCGYMLAGQSLVGEDADALPRLLYGQIAVWFDDRDRFYRRRCDYQGR